MPYLAVPHCLTCWMRSSPISHGCSKNKRFRSPSPPPTTIRHGPRSLQGDGTRLPAADPPLVQNPEMRSPAPRRPRSARKAGGGFRRGTYVDGIVEIGVHLAEGLAFTHDAEIYHRDIKPSNVLLTEEGKALLLDFNLSTPKSNESRLIAGTLPYMAPEQLRGICDSPVGRSGELRRAGLICFSWGRCSTSCLQAIAVRANRRAGRESDRLPRRCSKGSLTAPSPCAGESTRRPRARAADRELAWRSIPMSGPRQPKRSPKHSGPHWRCRAD